MFHYVFAPLMDFYLIVMTPLIFTSKKLGSSFHITCAGVGCKSWPEQFPGIQRDSGN